MGRAKVCHLTSVHKPFDVRIYLKECRTLATQGYEVVLVAQHPQDEEADGVRLRGVPKARGRLHRITVVCWQVLRNALDEDADVYHFHDPELVWVAALLKLKGKKVIYDSHEDLPKQVLTKPWISPLGRHVISASAQLLDKLAAVMCDGIVAATSPIARHFPPAKTAVVQNFPIHGELEVPGEMPYPEREALVAYIGGISVIRGIRELVDAVGHLPLDAKLLLAGDLEPGPLKEELRAKEGWGRVEYLGWQSRAEVRAILGRARVGVVTLHPAPNYVESQPIKLFEYMIAGIPVVASDFPLWREIIDEAKCGLLVNPEDPDAIAEAITWLLNNPQEAEAMGRNGHEAVLTKYLWEREAERLLALYERLGFPSIRPEVH